MCFVPQNDYNGKLNCLKNFDTILLSQFQVIPEYLSITINKQFERHIFTMSDKNQNKKENKDSNKGLASADQETRERVAREGGKASHKNDQ